MDGGRGEPVPWTVSAAGATPSPKREGKPAEPPQAAAIMAEPPAGAY